ncbi:glycoside hydrolase family 3 C-terminal domain-containing protein [Streptomyces koyangensis]|uniref:Glycosyl hydrolase n=1 Tax=Streptomyces koyangensis TaxID=188770 RepID=A0A385D5L3_9ACTN|nr:glycoside hydrolase family 3 C-terminal domain-containing protein [Streptomyces koyangensis]AXQ53304.1 glycosyl hydrolase [Streptomyces koyangensis]
MLTDHEAARLVEKLGLERKVRLLTGADTWRTGRETALGLRAMTLSDGPAGVRGTAWDERLTSLLLPSPTALAALWDETLVGEVGAVLAAEARRKGVDVVLAPTLNLHRSPLGGRHFECFSEDPWLAGRVGAALVRGVQGGGVAATAKHFVANDAETERLTVDVRVGERALREVYLAPFEAAVAAGVWVVMSAYNRVGGEAMAASGLLREPLKAEWGFDGVVVSDWGAVREPLEGAAGGLDLVMPGPGGPWGEALVAAVREGRVPESAVDEKVTRLLRLASRVGALEDSGPSAPPPPPPGARAVARRVAASSAVLLRNDGTLPLRPGQLRTVAVIGPHAVRPRVQGGGSAEVFPERVVSPLDGLRAALPGVRVVAVPGPVVSAEPVPLDPPLARRPGTDEPGVRVRMLDAAGGELYAEDRLSGRILEPRLVAGAHTVEVAARLVPEEAGVWTFGVAGWGRMSLTVDGEAVVEGVFPRDTDDPTAVHVKPPLRTGRVRLAAGRPVEVAARRELGGDDGRAIMLCAAPPEGDPAEAVAHAARAAAAADAAVVVVGTTEESESEGRDRSTLELPGSQDALVRAVLGAQPRTVVCVNAGGPVELPWRGQAPALLLTWFGGQEAGAGLADVLTGAAEPGGRLPTTWPTSLAETPVRETRPTGGRLVYEEGLHLGYRAWLRAGTEPAFWFGHGLGYTRWTYESMEVGPAGDGGRFTVRVRVRNTGERAGREVVQVYLERPDSALERPVRWLAGYAAVEAEPGAAVEAVVRVGARAVEHWSVEEGGWRREPGVFTVRAGCSAGDLRLTGTVETG